jgi:hypothetical protein
MNRSSSLMSVLVVFGAAIQTVSAQQKGHIVVQANRILPLATTMSAVSANPGTISFTATDPDLGLAAGSSAATISWTTSGGNKNSTWSLAVQANATTFSGCSTVPTSAVVATCTGVGGGTNGTCGGGVPLSTVAQQIATGNEANGANKAYSVNINFTLADSWSYIASQASSCTLSLTYTVTAP